MKSLIISFALFSAYGFGQTEPKLAASSVEPLTQEKETPKSEPKLALSAVEPVMQQEQATTKAEPQLAAFSIVETPFNKGNNLTPISIEPVKKETTSEEKK